VADIQEATDATIIDWSVRWVGRLAEAMFDIAFIWVFSVGMAAAFNPCGAAMFPAYVGYQLGTVESDRSPVASGLNGIVMGLAATAGFVVVFGVVGLLLAAGGWVVRDLLPFIGLGIGVLITATGLWLLISRRKIGIMAASRVNLGQGRGLKNIFLFGIAYALASLSCALPLFLVAVGISIGQTTDASDVPSIVIRTVTYGLGMGAVIIAATLGIVFFKDVVSRWMRVVFRYIEDIGKVAMVGAGGYLIFYWTLGEGSAILSERAGGIF
jgi:cytochrome c biogenesis protein CcdA